MSDSGINKLLTIAATAAGVWLGGKYLLPLALPFLLGLALALAAEPGVGLLSKKLSRGTAAFIGVSVALVLLTGAVLLLASVAVRELGNLAGIAPDLEDSARRGLVSLEDWLLGLAQKAPNGIQSLLTRMVLALFDSGSSLFDQAVSQLPQLATGILSHLTGSVVGVGTGLLSAYLISARLPKLKAWLGRRIPENWRQRYLPALKGLKAALAGWLKAQLKLMVLTFAIVCGGLLLLRVAYAPIWAFLVALVDALPMLGTAVILVPWSLVAFLQGETVQGLGLLGIFAVCWVTRNALEPRLVGKQLGLDPLVTLLALYLGYRLFGVLGMLLSPILAVTAMQLINAGSKEA